MLGLSRLLVLSLLAVAVPSAVSQQATPETTGAAKNAASQQAQPTQETLAAAAVDKFLKGVKLADLPEGRAMLADTQWITGEADNGANFYERPVYTDARTLYEGMFDTDVPGVQGYKRLMEMDAVSEAKTPLKIRFIAIAYRDRATSQWKVLDTGTDDSVDIERNLMYFESHRDDTQYTSEQHNYLAYGHWLLLAGRIKAAKQALLHARDGNPFSAIDPGGKNEAKYVPLQKIQIAALLEVINRIAGI